MKIEEREIAEKTNTIIVSEPTTLAVNIISDLLRKNCKVVVISSNQNSWKNISRIKQLDIETVDLRDIRFNNLNYSYLIYINSRSYFNKEKVGLIRNIFKKAISNSVKNQTRNVFVFSEEKQNAKVGVLLKKLKNKGYDLVKYYFSKKEINEKLVLKKLFIEKSRNIIIEAGNPKKVVAKSKIILLKKKSNPQHLFYLFVLLLLLIFPYLINVFNLFNLSVVKHLMSTNKNVYLKTILVNINGFTYVSDKIAYQYSNFPLLGRFYLPSSNYSNYLSKTSEILLKEEEIQNINLSLISNLLENTDNVELLIDKLRLDSQSLKEMYQFYQADYLKGEGDYHRGFLNLMKLPEIQKNTEKINDSFDLVNNLNSILGVAKEKSYILVVQDEEVIKPTGGLITGLYLLNVASGRIEKAEFYKPEDIDKNILGSIDTPTALRLYRGSGWQFADSNWDPVGDSSAKDIEWFIEKSLNIKNDGVIFLRKQFMSGIPGLENATNNQNLIDDLKKIKQQKRQELLLQLIRKMEPNDIQIYMNNESDNASLKKAGLSVSSPPLDCQDKCQNDFFKIVESDMNLSGYNLVVKRKANLEVSVEGGVVKKQLKVKLSRINEGKKDHQIYLRFISPLNVGFSPATINGEKVAPMVDIKPNYKEIGFPLNFLKDENTKEIEINWEGSIKDFEKDGVYSFTWVHQPGIQNFSADVNINLLDSRDNKVIANLSLTEKGQGSYNTSLPEFNRDINFKLFLGN